MTDYEADLMIAHAEIATLKRQLAESRRRERAAVEDLYLLMQNHPLCELCKLQGSGLCEYSSCPPYRCLNSEWRGTQDEKGEADG